MVDAEAIVLCGGRLNVVESIAIAMYDDAGEEVLAEEYQVYQPLDADGIAAVYGVHPDEVVASAAAYSRITGDREYVHVDPSRHARWRDVRRRILHLCKTYAAAVYAKGPALERTIFGGALEIADLAPFGCPKYPGTPHDPLSECRFFSRYIPRKETEK